MARVIAKLEPGGAQLSALRVARALAAHGHRTRLLVGHASQAGVALARAHGLEPELMGAEQDLQWRCDPQFSAWLAPRLVGADVVHAHMFGAWWAAGRAVGSGVPLVASEHNDLSWPGQPLWSAMVDVLGRVDRLYAHSPGAWERVLALGMPAERVASGVSPVEGFEASERPGLPWPRILYTGRLAPDKGPDLLVEAVAGMAEPPAVLLLGAGALEGTLRARITDAGLDGVVRLCGWIAEPATWVAGASVQVCPSREEAFSQAAVLAMGLGVPVVGTRVDGLSETLSRDRGVIVEPDDPEALAAALDDVLCARRTTDLAGARAWARQFDTERVASLYEQDYLRLFPVEKAAA